MKGRKVTVLVSLIVFLTFVASLLCLATHAATTVTVLDGAVSVTGSSTTSVSGNVVTATAKGGLLSQTTNTITIKNETDGTATVSFDYTASNYSSFSESSASGTKSVLLVAGETTTMSIKGKKAISSNTATLKLSNFSISVAAESSSVTFIYDNSLGSITVGGSEAATGTTQNVSLADGVAMNATASDSTFLGWIDTADNSILSTDASFTLIPTKDITVKAVFAKEGGTPWFGVAGATEKTWNNGFLNMTSNTYYTVSTAYSYLFDDLNAAASAATSSTNKYIVLLNSGTLPAGNYTIHTGVTLLIPYDSSNTLYTTEPQEGVGPADYEVPSAYRTLTLSSGTNLTINGSMSISAKVNYAANKANEASPIGQIGFVNMVSNSTITVNNGGNLYAWGYIIGDGKVTANSGASIYECFQFCGYRGGDQSTSMKNGVFPLSQYYVQNIEVTLELYAGAKEYAYTIIYASQTIVGSTVNFIGSSGCMFNLSSGYVTKRYDGSTDRLIIDLYGDVTISNIKLDITAALLSNSIDSKDYEMPINSNITINLHSGTTTVQQDLALLPGSKVTIASGTILKIGSGANVYVYDTDQWGNYVYCEFKAVSNELNVKQAGSNIKIHPLYYAPSKTHTRTEADLVDVEIIVNGTIDATEGYIYTTSSGAKICSTGNGVVKFGKAAAETATYQVIQASDPDNSEYPSIPITLAQLQHGDGTYVSTVVGDYYYHAEHKKWVKDGHSEVSELTTAPTCTEKGTKTYKCTCGVDLRTEEVSATGHNYEAVVTAPTCTEKGYTTYTCSACGDNYKDNYVDALSHSYSSEITTQPTCTTAGVKTFTCSGCGDTYTEEISATGHTESWVDQDGDGIEDSYCKVCNKPMGDTRLASKLTVEYRLQDYLWLNAVCYLDKSFANITQEDVKSGKLSVSLEGADLVVANDENGLLAIYIVKKIPSDEIADTVTFTITYNGLTSAPITISVADCKYTQEQIDEMTDADKSSLKPNETNDLVDALITYGQAAKKYFVTGGTPDSSLTKPTMTDYIVFGKKFDASGSYNNVTLITKGANVLFEERLSMMFGFQLSGTLTEDDVVQVGVLIGSVNGGELTATLENVQKAYILYGTANEGVSSDNKPTLPNYDNFEIDTKSTVSWEDLNADGRMILYMDLKSEDYTSSFEFRPFVITKDGTVLYGQQYAYSLADYINNMLNATDAQLQSAIGTDKNIAAFRNLLIATWDYALKAEAKFG